MSAPPQAIALNPDTNLLNVYIQIAKKWGFNKKNLDIIHHPVFHLKTQRFGDYILAPTSGGTCSYGPNLSRTPATARTVVRNQSLDLSVEHLVISDIKCKIK
jgi:hypothetical protein